MVYVLITGASRGIGYELARLYAANGYGILGVSRNAQTLDGAMEKLTAEYAVPALAIVEDLRREGSALSVYEQVISHGVMPQQIIFNAGFNEAGQFLCTDLGKEVDMVKVHLVSVMETAKLFLPHLKDMDDSRLAFLASTGAFTPVPNNAVYCALKSYILNFGLALRHELRNTRTKVTVICPGATKTDFPVEAEIAHTRLFSLFPMKPEATAKAAFKGVQKGRAICIPGLYNKIIRASAAVSPAFLTNRISDWMYSAR